MVLNHIHCTCYTIVCTCTATQGLAQLTQNDDEVFSGTPSSPPIPTVGPLSPATGGKTVTPLKSTSQVCTQRPPTQ